MFAAFIAALLELSQILMRLSGPKSNFGMEMDLGVSAVTIAQEVGLGFSTGLRLLFFWAYVGEPPRAEQPLRGIQRDLHSGSWNRWGVTGSLLQWVTGSLVVAVFVLQLIWRIEQQFTDATVLYNIDAAIEIILSAVFLLKLGLNIWLCTAAPLSSLILSYSGFIIALVMSTGIGLGSLISCKEYF